jgi:hypothetical protein
LAAILVECYCIILVMLMTCVFEVLQMQGFANH